MTEQEQTEQLRASEALIGLLQNIARRSQVHAGILPQQVESVRFWEGILFSIGGEMFVSPLNEIVEILNYPSVVTEVPGTRPWVRGIANIRGNLLPIIDLQTFLGGGRTATGRRSRVLVMHLGELFSGLLVGNMVGMRHFDEADRTECRTIDGSTARYVTGAFEYDGEVLPVFSMQALANSPDFLSVAV